MSKTTTDRKTIEGWAQAKGGKPAAVASTHKRGDAGIVRIMFPDSRQSENDNLVEISWDEFFDKFEEQELALVYEEDSMFSKIVGRDSVEERQHARER
jgi:hypothetical protein